MAEVLVALLSSLGHVAEAVPDARRALERTSASAFDVVVVDQGLPDRPGTELAVAIRQAQADLVLVLLTGDARVAAGAPRPTGIDAVGLKPLGIDGLRMLLEEGHRNAAARRDHAREGERPAEA